MNLRAFIGSSAENLNVANAIRHNLQDEVDCIVWTEPGFFRLSRTPLQTFVERIDEFDFGIFVFGRDDEILSRGEAWSITRDNVIYEFGLFCGRLGPSRALIVRSRNKLLKWLTDLEGLTAAEYDDALAGTNADKAVEGACAQIRSELDRILPRCGVFANGQWTRLGRDWWTYGGAEPSSTVADDDGVQLTTQQSIGLMYPHFDNLGAHGRYCALRFMPISSSPSKRLYISLRTETEKVLLALSDSHASEGWGVPQNEFMIRLPHLQEDRYESVVIDLDELMPYIGQGR